MTGQSPRACWTRGGLGRRGGATLFIPGALSLGRDPGPGEGSSSREWPLPEARRCRWERRTRSWGRRGRDGPSCTRPHARAHARPTAWCAPHPARGTGAAELPGWGQAPGGGWGGPRPGSPGSAVPVLRGWQQRGHPALPSAPQPGRRDLPQEALQALFARIPSQERRAAHDAGGRPPGRRPGLTPALGTGRCCCFFKGSRLRPSAAALFPPLLLPLGPSPLLFLSFPLSLLLALSLPLSGWLVSGSDTPSPVSSLCLLVCDPPSVCPGPSGPWGSPGPAPHWLPLGCPSAPLSLPLRPRGLWVSQPLSCSRTPSSCFPLVPPSPLLRPPRSPPPPPPPPSETSKNVREKTLAAQQPGGLAGPQRPVMGRRQPPSLLLCRLPPPLPWPPWRPLPALHAPPSCIPSPSAHWCLVPHICVPIPARLSPCPALAQLLSGPLPCPAQPGPGPLLLPPLPLGLPGPTLGPSLLSFPLWCLSVSISVSLLPSPSLPLPSLPLLPPPPPSSPLPPVLHFPFVSFQPSAPVITSRGRPGHPRNPVCSPVGRLLPSPVPCQTALEGRSSDAPQGRGQHSLSRRDGRAMLPRSGQWHEVGAVAWPAAPLAPGLWPRPQEEQPSPLFLRLG